MQYYLSFSIKWFISYKRTNFRNDTNVVDLVDYLILSCYQVFCKIETTMELFLCVFSHVRVSDAFMQLSQLRRSGFAEGIYFVGSYNFRFM